MATELLAAFRRLLEEAEPLGTERVPLDAAAGRVAGADVRCPHPVPHFRRSAMDGYVVWSADVAEAAPDRPVRLRVTGQVRMGTPPGAGPAPGEAWRVPTGGAMPVRGDRVIPIESVRQEGEFIVVSEPPPRKPHVAEPGEEIRPGACLVGRGEVLSPAAVGALAACGFSEVEVYRRPRVALLSTGDELDEPTAPLAPGRIRNSNAPALAGELELAGCEVEFLGIVRDDPAALREAFRRALGGSFDVILTTGGVSVGPQDRVPRTWLDLGARRVLGRLDLKPGGPFFAGRLGSSWGIGLSGNPAACLASYHLLVRPFLLRLGGRRYTVRPIVSARLRTPIERGADRMRALWVSVRGDPPEAEVPGDGVLYDAARANGLALLRPETPPLRAGSRVPVLCLDRPEDRTELVIPPVLPAPLVVGIVGPSGAGKTTAIEGLLRRLRAEGVEVAAIKHASHGFCADRPGSDSDRMARAGACAVLVAGPGELFLRTGADAPVDRLVDLLTEVGERVGRQIGVVLVEGFRHPDRPVVQVGPDKGTPDSPWYVLPALAELEPARWEALLDELADRIRAWGGGIVGGSGAGSP